jgi:tetratricopeptide (TPR) repeat protein
VAAAILRYHHTLAMTTSDARGPGFSADPDPSLAFSAEFIFAGRYQMLKRLGRGGMGEVWSAIDLTLKMQVALKLVHSVNARNRAAILHEVRLARQVTHPAICRVYDVGESDGIIFYTMELVQGEDLAACLARAQRLPSPVVIDIARQLCGGLAAAHAAGVLHRDLKPANVLIGSHGRVRITDFGVAVSRDAADRTLPMGTPAYMAPEQLEPGAPLTEQTDLYALGLLLYELSFGRRLYDGVETRGDLAQTPVPTVDVDPDLRAVILWALELDPARRPPSADVMAARLPEASPHPPRRAAAANPSFPRWAAVMFGAVVTVVLVAWLMVPRSVSPTLNERDTIVLADFDNGTGEPVFDGTLDVALAVALEQSPFIKVFSRERVGDTLQRMEQAADARLTRQLARDVARREQLKAFVTGSITRLGASYVLALEAVDAQAGDTMARAQAQAANREQVLSALGEAATTLRQRLGESLASVERFDAPLPDATTSSLEALHAYALALDEGRVAMRLSAIPPLERAIELDPDFAMAHATLSGVYANTDQPGLAPAYARRAFDLRARVSQRERFFISWRYYRDAAFAFDQALDLTRSWTGTYPRESIAFNSLALTLKDLAQFEPAIEAFRTSMALDPKFFAPYGNLAEVLIAMNRLDEAAATLALASERHVESAAVRRVGYLLAMMRRDAAGMAAAVERSGSLSETNPLQWEARTAMFEGRIADAHALSTNANTLALERGLDESAAQFMVEDAEAHAAAGQCADTRREMAAALAMSRDIFSLQRGARAYALCGDAADVRALARELRERFPEAFLAQRLLLPIADAALALARSQPAEAMRALSAIAPYEAAPLGELWPWYLTGLAQLQLKNGQAAAAAFQKVLEHQGIRPSSMAYPLARLGHARAAALINDRVTARQSYDQFLTLWTDDTLAAVRDAKTEREAIDR